MKKRLIAKREGVLCLSLLIGFVVLVTPASALLVTETLRGGSLYAEGNPTISETYSLGGDWNDSDSVSTSLREYSWQITSTLQVTPDLLTASGSGASSAISRQIGTTDVGVYGANISCGFNFTPLTDATYTLTYSLTETPGSTTGLAYVATGVGLDFGFAGGGSMLGGPGYYTGTLVGGTQYRLYAMTQDLMPYNTPGYTGHGWSFDLTVTEQTSAVPIPSTIWLLTSGIMGMVGLRRRLRKR